MKQRGEKGLPGPVTASGVREGGREGGRESQRTCKVTDPKK